MYLCLLGGLVVFRLSLLVLKCHWSADFLLLVCVRRLEFIMRILIYHLPFLAVYILRSVLVIISPASLLLDFPSNFTILPYKDELSTVGHYF